MHEHSSPTSHSPSSPGTGFMPERELPVSTLPYRDSAHRIPSSGALVLTVSSPDLRTVHVTGSDEPYTMVQTYEDHTEVVTITRGSKTVARLELHDIRSSKVSILGGRQLKLKNWLHGTATNVHSFPVNGGGIRCEWHKVLQGLSFQYELYDPDFYEPIAFARKGHGLGPMQEDSSVAPQRDTVADRSGEGLPLYSSVSPPPPYAMQEHSSSPRPANATLWLTPRAVNIQDLVVISYLLMDRETRPDPLQG